MRAVAVVVVVDRVDARGELARPVDDRDVGDEVARLGPVEVGCDVGVGAVDAGVDDADLDGALARLEPVRAVRGRADLPHVPLPVGQRLGGRRGGASTWPLPDWPAAASSARSLVSRSTSSRVRALARASLGAYPITRLCGRAAHGGGRDTSAENEAALLRTTAKPTSLFSVTIVPPAAVMAARAEADVATEV